MNDLSSSLSTLPNSKFSYEPLNFKEIDLLFINHNRITEKTENKLVQLNYIDEMYD